MRCIMEEKRNEKRDEKRKSNNRTVIIVLSVIVGLGILSNFFGEKEPQTNDDTPIQEETVSGTTEAGTSNAAEITAEITTVADTTETPQEYKESCQAMDYKTIARQPELYEGKNIKVTGEVWQVVEEGDDALYQINIDKTEYGYDYNSSVQIIYKDAKNNFRVLEDDIITVYGEYKGIVSYTTVLGAKQSIPQISAKYVELQQEETTESN